MADIEQLKRALVNADKAGDVAAAQAFAREIRAQLNAKPKIDDTPINATDGMSTTQKVLAGIGMSMVDAKNGLGQMLGLVDQKEIDAAKVRNADLVNSGAGTVGNMLGNVAMLAPTALIPGANTVTGAGLINALAGAAMTPGGLAERGQAALFGGGGAAGATGAVKLLSGAGRAAQAAAAPMTEKGREKIVGEVMRRAAGQNVDDVIGRLKGAQELIPGAAPTAAEVANSGGIAALQRAMGQANPEAYTARGMQNATARVDALRGIAKDEQAMQAAKAARSAAADPLYAAADKAIVTSDDNLRAIMARLPNGTLEQAKDIARMKGKPVQIGRDIPAQTLYKNEAGELIDPALMKPPVGPKGRNLLDEIKKAGGIKMDEVGELGMSPVEAVRGNPGLFRRDGMSADGLVEFMQQQGWMADDVISRANQFDTGGAPEMAKEYIRTALGRDPVYHPSQAMDLFEHNQAMQNFGEFAKGITRTDIPAKDAKYTGYGIDLIKKSIDDVVNTSPTAAIGKNAKDAGLSVKQDLVNWADQAIPEYGLARQAWAEGSKPISQMQVGQELMNKLQPALVQFHPDKVNFAQTGNSYASALNDVRGNLVKNATGGIKQSLEDVMTPQQMQTLNAIGQDLSRKSMAQSLGRGEGSNTFQNFAMDNLASQSGMPPAVSAIGNFLTLGQGSKLLGGLKIVGNKLYQGADDKMKQSMADYMLNPQQAAVAMENAVKPSRLSQAFTDKLGAQNVDRLMGTASVAPGVLGAAFALPYGSQ